MPSRQSMASPIATAQHSGPLDTAGELAYRYARSGIARSATTRSNYVSLLTSIDWIERDTAGNIIRTTDISGIVLLNTLHVTQALNDEPDTCSLTLKPQDPPAAIPQVGQEIRITWAPGGPPLFHGYIVTVQADWRLLNQQPQWVAIQCQDPMWRFDARIVTYRFPAQSVTASIAFLVKWFCNIDPTTAGPLNFSTAFVQEGMPSIPAFDVVNQRPSTVMRTLTASVGGGFYIEGLTVHAWAGSVSEPLQTNPTPLTVGLKTLHAVRLTENATQVRRRVLVEGRRTASLIGWPTFNTSDPTIQLGIPLEDATIFPALGETPQRTRMGTQWMYIQYPITVTVDGKNPPQTTVHTAYTPGQNFLVLKALPVGMVPPPAGWIRVGNQYARYASIVGTTTTDGWSLELVVTPAFIYGFITVPLGVGDTVEWVNGVVSMYPHGVGWAPQNGGDNTPRAQPADTPVVTLAVAEAALDQWPPLEGFVQDGRYSYAGAQARADDDLATFKDPLISLEWETDDLNALPGRSQVIALSSDTVNPPLNTTVTILRVEIAFPLRTLPPRRTCTGGMVKPSSFMDLVVTTTN